jgi:hypothetical protein
MTREDWDSFGHELTLALRALAASLPVADHENAAIHIENGLGGIGYQISQGLDGSNRLADLTRALNNLADALRSRDE